MRDDNCIFCKIANGEIPSATVYEDDDFRAILDLGPASNGHTLILPRIIIKTCVRQMRRSWQRFCRWLQSSGNP